MSYFDNIPPKIDQKSSQNKWFQTELKIIPIIDLTKTSVLQYVPLQIDSWIPRKVDFWWRKTQTQKIGLHNPKSIKSSEYSSQMPGTHLEGSQETFVTDRPAYKVPVPKLLSRKMTKLASEKRKSPNQGKKRNLRRYHVRSVVCVKRKLGFGDSKQYN